MQTSLKHQLKFKVRKKTTSSDQKTGYQKQCQKSGKQKISLMLNNNEQQTIDRDEQTKSTERYFAVCCDVHVRGS